MPVLSMFRLVPEQRYLSRRECGAQRVMLAGVINKIIKHKIISLTASSVMMVSLCVVVISLWVYIHK